MTAVTSGGEQIAALVHDPALLDEPALVESVRATAGLVLENERLAAEVRSQLAEVRAQQTPNAQPPLDRTGRHRLFLIAQSFLLNHRMDGRATG